MSPDELFALLNIPCLAVSKNTKTSVDKTPRKRLLSPKKKEEDDEEAWGGKKIKIEEPSSPSGPENMSTSFSPKKEIEDENWNPNRSQIENIVNALVCLPTSPINTSYGDSSICFCDVPGRLTAHKYSLTISEIKRRVYGPEKFTLTSVCTIMRKAKVKNGTHDLRQQLWNFGIEFNDKKKKERLTSFTFLTEGETKDLAKDFHNICESSFPVKSMAEELNTRDKMDKDGTKEALTRIKALDSLLFDDKSLNMSSQSILSQHLQDELLDFSMLTHGFGTSAVRSGLNIAIRILEASLNQGGPKEDEKLKILQENKKK